MNPIIICLGHGGGIPSPFAGNTNFAVVPNPPEGGFDAVEILKVSPYWLIDCGPETITALTEIDAVKNLQGVVLTHCHTDHSGGLTSLAWRLLFVERRKIRLYLSQPVLTMLRKQAIELTLVNKATEKLLFGSARRARLEDYFDIEVLPPECCWAQPTPEVFFRLISADHNVENFPCNGVEVAINGRRVAFTGDSVNVLVPTPSLVYVFQDTQAYELKGGLDVHCPYNVIKETYATLPFDIRGSVVLCHTKQDDQYAQDGFRQALKWSTFPIS